MESNPRSAYGKSVLTVGRLILYSSVGVVLLVYFFPNFLNLISGGSRGRYLRQQQHYATAYKTGDTNVPLLAMDWFAPTVHFCRVSQSGKGSARRDVGHAIQAGVAISLDEPGLEAMIETLNRLPPPPKHSLPVERQIVVGCIRSNRWFRGVYDRADIPKELERVSEVTGAYLPWYIPPASGRPAARLNIPDFRGQFACAARDTPIAISWGQRVVGNAYIHPGEIQVWDLKQSATKASCSLKLITAWPSRWCFTISPDGRTLVVATDSDLNAVDWKNEKVLWQAGPLEHEGHLGRHLVIGDNGQTLFAAGAHTIERRDLMTGQHRAILMANETNSEGIVRFLKSSGNGKVLVAGFGLHLNDRPRSFAVWEAGKDEPFLKFEETEGAFADPSPNGDLIALSRFGRESLVLFKWRTKERTEVRLANSRGTYSVYWSPDGKKLAAYADTYPASIFVYETTTWKPLAHWECGQIGQSSEFSFANDGTLYQIRNDEINALDILRLKRLTD